MSPTPPAASGFSLALQPGTLLAEQYEIERVLGEPGGFGIVYLARDIRLDLQVAVKEFLPRELAGRGTDRTTVLPHSLDSGELFEYGLQQFLQEARTLAKLHHPGIVRVRTFFEGNGTAYLVMDYYKGETLAAHLNGLPGGRMAPRKAVKLMIGVLEALAAAHAQEVLHRDVKPQNIYLTREGRPILLDFGAAREAVGQRTRSITTILTPGYAPVEQYTRQGKSQGPWTDVYACAATLYRMVAGVEPADAPDRMMEQRLTPPSQYASELWPELERAILKGLELDYRKRPQTAAQFTALISSAEAPAAKPQSEATTIAVGTIRNTTSKRVQERPWINRLRKTLSPKVISVLLVTLLGLVSGWQALRVSAERARQSARTERALASADRSITAAEAHLADGEYYPAAAMLTRARNSLVYLRSGPFDRAPAVAAYEERTYTVGRRVTEACLAEQEVARRLSIALPKCPQQEWLRSPP